MVNVSETFGISEYLRLIGRPKLLAMHM